MIAWLAGAARAVEVDCAPGDPIVGPAPLAVECRLGGTAGATWDEVRWSWGDGTETTGAVGRHRYADAGVFRVEAEILGWSDGAPTLGVEGPAPVTACGPESAQFEWIRTGDRTIRLEDASPSVPGCRTALRWIVTDEDGTPVASPVDGVVLLPDGGPFVVRLELDGIGGPSAAEATVTLPERAPEPASAPTGCRTGPGAVGLGWVVAALRTRRRRPTRRATTPG